MQRDMDLIREILFRIEDHADGFAPRELHFDGNYTEAQIRYHVWLLGNAGLMNVAETTHMQSGGPEAIPVSLTWEGYEFIAAARNDQVWSKAKEKAKTVGGAVSLAVFKQLLESILKHQLGI